MIIRIVIRANIEKVWAAIEDVESHHEWMMDAESIEPVEQEPQQPFVVGNRYLAKTKVGPFKIDDYLTITNIKKPNLLEASHDGVVKGMGSFVLVDLGSDETKLIWSEKLKFPWKLGGPIAKAFAYPVLRTLWTLNLYALKKKIESSK